MNSLSKVTLLVTLLSVPFAGFAMEKEEATGKFDLAKSYGKVALTKVTNFGFNSYEATKDFAIDSYDLLKTNPARFGANATGGLVLAGMGALVLYNIYSVAKASKAPQIVQSDVKAPQDQTVAPVVQEVDPVLAGEKTELASTDASTAIAAPVTLSFLGRVKGGLVNLGSSVYSRLPFTGKTLEANVNPQDQQQAEPTKDAQPTEQAKEQPVEQAKEQPVEQAVVTPAPKPAAKKPYVGTGFAKALAQNKK